MSHRVIVYRVFCVVLCLCAITIVCVRFCLLFLAAASCTTRDALVFPASPQCVVSLTIHRFV